MKDKLNSKMKQDIENKLESKKAKLAISILNKVEEKKLSHSDIKELASQIYNGDDRK